MEKLRSPAERLWYARKTVEHGWSRSVLLHQIQTRLHARSGRAVTNFGRALPEGQTDLVRELLKDPYHFEFLQLLGPSSRSATWSARCSPTCATSCWSSGWGSRWWVARTTWWWAGRMVTVDLLFYHISLCRYVIVELKVGAFTPEDAGRDELLPPPPLTTSCAAGKASGPPSA